MPKPSHFSRAATTYDKHAVAQTAIAEELCQLLVRRKPCEEAQAGGGGTLRPELFEGPPRQSPDELEVQADLSVKNILEIGSGTGILTEKLARLFPDAKIEALDLSSEMIEFAASKLRNEKINFTSANFLEFETEKKYDLVVSSSTLHWIELEKAFKKIENLLKKEGIFAASLITKGTFKELKAIRKEVAPNKPPIRELPEEKEVLNVIGLSLGLPKTFYEKEFPVYYNSAAEFFSSIKALGVTGGDFSRSKLLLSRKEICDISKKYEERYKVGGKLIATYNSAFIVLKK